MAKKNSDLIPGAKNLKALRGALEHSVTIQMTRLQEVVDDLVVRGSLTRAEADKLIDQLVSTSKAYTHALLEVVETVSVETRKNIEAGLTSATAPVKATAKKLKGKVTGKAKDSGKKAKDSGKKAKDSGKKAKSKAKSKAKEAGKSAEKKVAKIKAAAKEKVPAVKVKLPSAKPKPPVAKAPVANAPAKAPAKAPAAKAPAAKKPAARAPKLALVQKDPIPDFADLSIARIRPLLAGLTPAELSQVRGQEAAGKARVSLIAEIDRALKN